MNLLLATSGPSPLWYLTRGSGVVALLLLTLSICLGIGSTLAWGSKRLPRFAVAGLHRSATLLAVVFVVVHVLTTVLDTYAHVRLTDALIPFVSSYRPIWLGLGALAFDLLLALIVTSLLRARIGYRLWRATHWFAYVSWPIALVHALGTGSDGRVGWLQALAAGSVLAVAVTIALRVAQSQLSSDRRLTLGAAAIGLLLAMGLWYDTGPGAAGWAARAGTPTALLAHHGTVRTTALVQSRGTKLAPFHARISGHLSQSGGNENGLVLVRIDSTLRGHVHGTLRLVLQGFPVDDGGVNMTANGVAMAVSNSPTVYEGQIVSLAGTEVTAQVTAPGGGSYRLRIAFRIDQAQGRVGGTVVGTPL